ncbi:hypothetical protein RN001_011282 [Aquatica leii]|uniref:Uncharacterized protein n=1 Tax=Aquatica leii TaxID=1421715 RepID=A0AAN7S8W4_9COLE|nr:hypothetical protein RN001_011282 [Aquatica leii]
MIFLIHNFFSEIRWIVAHFQKDNTVEVVPKAWTCTSDGKGVECFWPSYQNKIKIIEAVRTTASPQCDWKIYSINILGAYDNYGKAQSKCNKAKDTDDLSSSASAGDDFGLFLLQCVWSLDSLVGPFSHTWSFTWIALNTARPNTNSRII